MIRNINLLLTEFEPSETSKTIWSSVCEVLLVCLYEIFPKLKSFWLKLVIEVPTKVQI